MFLSLLGAWPPKGVTTALRSTVSGFQGALEHRERLAGREAVPLEDLHLFNAVLTFNMV